MDSNVQYVLFKKKNIQNNTNFDNICINSKFKLIDPSNMKIAQNFNIEKSIILIHHLKENILLYHTNLTINSNIKNTDILHVYLKSTTF
jgi:hypothetical protein